MKKSPCAFECYKKGLLQNEVIMNCCAYWCDIPHWKPLSKRIATPVCGLVRNDKIHFATGPFCMQILDTVGIYSGSGGMYGGTDENRRFSFFAQLPPGRARKPER